MSSRQLYWQKLCATHKNKITYGESSQIDGLEADKITFKDYHLIWWANVGFTNFLTTNKLGYSEVILPAAINLTNSTTGDLEFMGGTKLCQDGCALDTWNILVYIQ